MISDQQSPVQLADADLASQLGALLDALADRLASRLLVLIERRPDQRAIKFAAIDVDTIRNLLDVAADVPGVDKLRQLAARVAAQLATVTR